MDRWHRSPERHGLPERLSRHGLRQQHDQHGGERQYLARDQADELKPVPSDQDTAVTITATPSATAEVVDGTGTATLVFPAVSVSVGQTVIIGVGWENGGITAVSVADSAGNTYTSHI